MSNATVELVRTPTREDRHTVEHFAGEPCECTPELRATAGHPEDAPEGVEQVLCKPCGARQVLNGVVTFAEEA